MALGNVVCLHVCPFSIEYVNAVEPGQTMRDITDRAATRLFFGELIRGQCPQPSYRWLICTSASLLSMWLQLQITNESMEDTIFAAAPSSCVRMYMKIQLLNHGVMDFLQKDNEGPTIG